MYLAVRGINFSEVGRSFRSANYLYTIPIIVIIVLVLFFRSYRWGIILAPQVKYPQWLLFRITAIGFMTISVLPARLGELTRPLLVKQKSGVRMSSTMATIVLERVFDLLTLMAVLGMVILMMPLPPEIFKAGCVILIGVLSIFGVLFKTKIALFRITDLIPGCGFFAFYDSNTCACTYSCSTCFYHCLCISERTNSTRSFNSHR